MKTYDGNFYKSNVQCALKSAEEIMPFLLGRLSPKSVVDFGCGGGLACCYKRN